MCHLPQEAVTTYGDTTIDADYYIVGGHDTPHPYYIARRVMILIENIVFDMGNVLVKYDAQRFIDSCTPSDKDGELLMRTIFRSVEWISMDRGTITQQQGLEGICKRLPERLYATAEHLLDSWHNDIPPFPEMEELAAKLKGAGYKIYLLSNTSARFHDFRVHIPALRYFDGEFISADWGMLKPDPVIYTTFCGHFGLVPARCFFIDDVAANIEGAQLAGMKGTVYHGDVAWLEEDLRRAGVRV